MKKFLRTFVFFGLSSASFADALPLTQREIAHLISKMPLSKDPLSPKEEEYIVTTFRKRKDAKNGSFLDNIKLLFGRAPTLSLTPEENNMIFDAVMQRKAFENAPSQEKWAMIKKKLSDDLAKR